MKNYADIINLPHYHDPQRPYMSRQDRAAQFAPFKALTGYEEGIETKTNAIMDDEWQTIVQEESA